MGTSRSWEDAEFGANPILYGRDVVEKCGIKHPPIDEKVIAEFLALAIAPITVGDTPEELARFSGMLPKIRAMLGTACAFLCKPLDLIFINEDMPHAKKRTSGFHELGHAAYPLHADLDFHACLDSSLDPITHQRIEQEAYRCGSELQMPGPLFVDDALSLSIGASAIKALAGRWDASLEATAIKYAQTHPGMAAVVVSEPVPPLVPSPNLSGDVWLPLHVKKTPAPSKESLWISRTTYGGSLLKDGLSFPMQVKYSVVSGRFPKRFIAPGTLIPETSAIYETYQTGRSWSGQLPAFDLGSSHARPPYFAECFSFGFNGDQKVMTILWFPDKQADFWRDIQ